MDFTVSTGRTLRSQLAASRVLRRIVLPVLSRLDRPITITHPYTGRPFRLLLYRHKGYWYFGKTREAATMQRIGQLVRPGDTVIEVGGHIGYLAQYLSALIGARGALHVFEPTPENAGFLTVNLAATTNTHLISAALSDTTGKVNFYTENFGGFMNSLDPHFASHSAQGRRRAAQLEVTTQIVQALRLDDYAARHGVTPDVIKIDAEGSELAVLRGATQTLRHARALIVEVTRNHAEVFGLLQHLGYRLSDQNGAAIVDPLQTTGNIFALRPAP